MFLWLPLTRDLDLDLFDPTINEFLPELIVKHICVKFGDPRCISFWDIVRKEKQTHRQKPVTTLSRRPRSALATFPGYVYLHFCGSKVCERSVHSPPRLLCMLATILYSPAAYERRQRVALWNEVSIAHHLLSDAKPEIDLIKGNSEPSGVASFYISFRLTSPRWRCEVFRSVCLFVCLSVRSHILKTTCPNFTKFSVHVMHCLHNKTETKLCSASSAALFIFSSSVLWIVCSSYQFLFVFFKF